MHLSHHVAELLRTDRLDHEARRAGGDGLRDRLAVVVPGQAQDAGVTDAFGYPGFVVAYIRPLFSRGAGPFRCGAAPS